MAALMLENVWLQQQKFEDANTLYQQLKAGTAQSTSSPSSGLAGEIAQVRQDIQRVLNKQPGARTKSCAASGGGDASSMAGLVKRLEALEKENKELRKITDDLRALILNIKSSEGQNTQQTTTPGKPAPSKPAPAPADDDDDDDDDIDLFGSEDEEEKALKAKRLEEYKEKKAKKPAVIAKSSVVLDVKPWDDETDMAEMEKSVRTIEMDGLVWGASKLVEVGYGIKKLTIMCVVEDEKVSIDDLSEKIQDNNEDTVQSVDIAAFNKI